MSPAGIKGNPVCRIKVNSAVPALAPKTLSVAMVRDNSRLLTKENANSPIAVINTARKMRL